MNAREKSCENGAKRRSCPSAGRIAAEKDSARWRGGIRREGLRKGHVPAGRAGLEGIVSQPKHLNAPFQGVTATDHGYVIIPLKVIADENGQGEPVFAQSLKSADREFRQAGREQIALDLRPGNAKVEPEVLLVILPRVPGRAR